MNRILLFYTKGTSSFLLMTHVFTPIVSDDVIFLSMVEQTFSPSDLTPLCLVLFATEDQFVENSENLTVRMSSSDVAVVIDNTTRLITLLDSSSGEATITEWTS